MRDDAKPGNATLDAISDAEVGDSYIVDIFTSPI